MYVSENSDSTESYEPAESPRSIWLDIRTRSCESKGIKVQMINDNYISETVEKMSNFFQVKIKSVRGSDLCGLVTRFRTRIG